jgi:hypothetical protein
VLTDGRSLSEVIVLIDEFHDFLKLNARIVSVGINCPYSIITTAYKTIGLSATFGGEQVKRDMQKLFPSSIFVKTFQEVAARKFDISINGKLDEANILTKTGETAR